MVRPGMPIEEWSRIGKGGAENRGPSGDYQRVHTLRPGEQEATGGMVYFSEGSNTLDEKQQQRLQIIAEELGGKPQKIEIRGHTSRRPPPLDAPFRDNWDLAYARCRTVLDYLVSLGLDPKRFRLAVAGENEPVPRGREERNADSTRGWKSSC